MLTPASTTTIEREVPCVDYLDLKNESNLSLVIEKAYGADGLGILAVSNVPQIERLREKLLPLAFKFANFPEEIKNKYVLEDAYYSFGWSHGKEKLQGKPDYSKGSFYNNPQYNRPVKDEATIAQYPAFIHPNIWPTEELPELEPAFMELGQQIIACGLLVAKQCDRYVHSKCSAYPQDKLFNIIQSSRSVKASEDLARHESQSSDSETEFSNWCGWHNDHSSLTGLVPALYTDGQGQVIDNPDPEAGLYVKTRDGQLIKANVPPGHLVYQIGEAAQIHSGGILQATPHAVRGPHCTGVNRETLAVFMGPDWNEKMAVPVGTDPRSAGDTQHLPHGVPALTSRWDNSMDFATFTRATHAAYY